MKQYRITSADFVSQGETGDTDAYMAPDDLAQLKRLAGVGTLGLLEDYTAGGHENSPQSMNDGAADRDMPSPVGSNISVTARDRNELLEKYNARPGDELWFLINFEPVRGLGANAGKLEEKIQEYLRQHPEARKRHVRQD